MKYVSSNIGDCINRDMYVWIIKYVNEIITADLFENLLWRIYGIINISLYVSAVANLPLSIRKSENPSRNAKPIMSEYNKNKKVLLLNISFLLKSKVKIVNKMARILGRDNKSRLLA